MNDLTIIATDTSMLADVISQTTPGNEVSAFKDILEEVSSLINIEDIQSTPSLDDKELIEAQAIFVPQEALTSEEEHPIPEELPLDTLDVKKEIKKPEDSAILVPTNAQTFIFQPVQFQEPSQENKSGAESPEEISSAKETNSSVLDWIEKSLQQEVNHQKNVIEIPIKSEKIQFSQFSENLTSANENKLSNQVELSMAPLKRENFSLTTHPFFSHNDLKEFNLNQETTLFDEKEEMSTENLENKLFSQTMAQSTPISQGAPEVHTQHMVNAHVSDKNWPVEVSQKLNFFANNEMSQATLILNPKDLGTIEAQIKIVDNKAEITLMSTHSQVRDTLEQSLPQLKQLFDNQDISLSKVIIAEPSINSGQQEQSLLNQGGFSNHSQQNRSHQTQEVQDKPRLNEIKPTLVKQGEIDYYA